ncbi:hypothetical protein AAFF_G00402340 [Aldrovandia affinis]|uniref:CHHC U11-48K-type domain-containing protein n=1 Tax=Aldrovandia affinis TaxID=143900 RepID=A0AAD7X075_9TELE|nr:hypothetical protein AAFF_G00402340 [Aldrovandia affinis]
MSDSPANSEVSDTLHCRLQSIQELTEFTESCQKQLNGLFEALGWSNESNANSMQQEPMEVCPYDHDHRVPRKSMERHKVSCRLNKMGYTQEEQAGMYDPTICYEKANVPSLVIDKATQQQIILKAKASAPVGRTEGLYSQTTGVSIKRKFELDCDYSVEPPEVPQNHKRVVCDLTVADRLALYDHVTREVSQQRAQAKPAENDDLYVDLVAKLKKEEQNGPKSHLEVLAEMRDYKRRRQSYRAKNVHITKKSYTEVIREVINVHSGELARLWGEEEKEEEEQEEAEAAEEEESRTSRHSSHRRRSEERRSVSVESRHSLALSSARDAHSSRRRRHRDKERDKERDRDRGRDDKRQRESHTPDERRRDRKKKRK